MHLVVAATISKVFAEFFSFMKKCEISHVFAGKAKKIILVLLGGIGRKKRIGGWCRCM